MERQQELERTRLVNEVRNEIERSILHHPKLGELTPLEIAFLLAELAFRWSLLALKTEYANES